jgi:hypothetical protein
MGSPIKNIQFIKQSAWLKFINLSTAIVGLAMYIAFDSNDWQRIMFLSLGALVILAGLMVLIRLQAEQRLKESKPLVPKRQFP